MGVGMRHLNKKSADHVHLPVRRGARMLGIAAIIFVHMLYVIAMTPNMQAYVILIEFIPFIICGVIGTIQAVYKDE